MATHQFNRREFTKKVAASLSAPGRSAAGSDRERPLVDEAQALGSRPWPFAPHADAPCPAARPEFQPVPLETSLHLPKVVNRAK